MSLARSHPATAVYQNRIFVFGGGGPDFKSLNASEVYDPGNQSWEAVREMPTLRSGAATIVFQDRIYVIGGGFKKPDGKFQFLTTVEIYDPVTDRWETGPDMLQPHDYPAYALLDGAIYIIGGHHPDATEGGPQTDPGFTFCERFRPPAGSWEELSPLPTPRFASNTIVREGRILCMGGVAFTPKGFREFDCVESYDPSENRWTQGGFSLPWTTAAHGSCLVRDRLYLFGGFSGEGGIGTQAGVYHFSDSRWETLPALPQSRAAMGVVVTGGMIYLVGGWAADRSVMESVAAFSLPAGR